MTAEGQQTILILEDEPIVALDLKMIVQDLGHAVTGPFATTAKGLESLATSTPDAALLDVRLRDGEVFPLADALSGLGVPIVFHSGHLSAAEMRKDYPKAILCPKPSTRATLAQKLSEATARAAA